MSSNPSPSISEESYSNGELVKRLLALSWAYRKDCIRVVLLQLVSLAFVVGGLRLAGLGVDVIHHYANPKAKAPDWPFGIDPNPSWEPLTVIALVAAGVLGFALLRAATDFGYKLSVARLVQIKLVTELRGQVYEKLQRLSFRFFDAKASSSLINRVTSDVQNVRVFVDGVLMDGLVILLSLSLFLGFMLSIHPLLTLACLATTPLLWVASVAFSRRARPALVENRELIDKTILALIENVQGIHAVKGFGREKEQIALFERASDRVRGHMGKVIWLISLFGSGTQALTKVNFVVLLSYGGYLVYQGDLALGSGIIVFEGLLRQFSNNVSNISGLANRVQLSLTGARRVFEILDTPIDVKSKPESTRIGKAKGAVEFREVSFAFKENQTVLREVSFKVEPGEKIAVVGATGSGKSALLSLIPRFYDADSGTVRIDGTDIRELDLENVRRGIGVVFQESFMFSNTIAANIAFGNPHADQASIEKAAKIAAAHDFIMEMPRGYETVLGETGMNLSGGQRQRLAIARAILLEPSILILDDPTASIDAETEDEILLAMDNAMEGRTTFIVAHRMSVLRRSDRVIVLEKGRIAQTGTHEELMQVAGLYRNLAELQIIDDVSRRDEILKGA